MIYDQNIIRIKINKQVIRDNIAGVKVKSKKIIAVLKGNAYGCGLVEMGELCIESGIDFAAVSYFAEAKALSEKFGDKLKILTLLPFHDTNDLQYAIENDIRITLTNKEQLHTVNNLAGVLGKKATLHIKADCGLGRLGFEPDAINTEMINQISAANCIVEGLYTHLSRADEQTMILELNRFDNIVKRLKGNNINIPILHVLSSAQLGDSFSSYHYDAVRVGSALFAEHNPLQVFTHIIDLKNIQKGSAIGYGQDFIMKNSGNVAFIPVGYSLGLGLEPVSRYYNLKGIARVFRSILNKSKNKDYQGSVTINNKKYPLVGRVGMNISAVLLGNDSVPVGTEVRLSLRQAALPDDLIREYE